MPAPPVEGRAGAFPNTPRSGPSWAQAGPSRGSCAPNLENHSPGAALSRRNEWSLGERRSRAEEGGDTLGMRAVGGGGTAGPGGCGGCGSENESASPAVQGAAQGWQVRGPGGKGQAKQSAGSHFPLEARSLAVGEGEREATGRVHRPLVTVSHQPARGQAAGEGCRCAQQRRAGDAAGAATAGLCVHCGSHGPRDDLLPVSLPRRSTHPSPHGEGDAATKKSFFCFVFC